MYCSSIFVCLLLLVVVHSSQSTYFDEHTLFHVEWPGKYKTGADKYRNDDSVFLATRNSENYVCYMPKDKAETEASDLRDSFLPTPSEIDLLRPLFDKDICVVKITSYWTYELCHGKTLRQYHKDEGIIKISNTEITSESSAASSFILGTYPEPDWRNQKLLKERYKASEKPPTYRFSRVVLPYYPVELEAGEICDLTMQPRQVRVFYFCQPDTKAEFYDIQEISTCTYEVFVFTSYLCDSKKYRASSSTKDVAIKCYINDEKSPSKPVELAKFRPSPPKYRDIFGRKPSASKKQAGDGDDDDDDDETVDDFWVLDQFGLGPVPDLDDEDVFSRYGRKSTTAKARKAFGQAQLAGQSPPAPVKPLNDYQHVKDFLRGTYCLHGGMPGGWWRYELCFGQWARQYHEEFSAEDRRPVSRAEVSIGYWRSEKHLRWLAANPTKRPKKPVEQRRSISYLYGDGDICEATGANRQAIVKLICNPTDLSEAIGISLSEPSTCSYEIDVVAGQWLCNVLRTADDDGLFDLETAIDSLTGDSATSPKPPQAVPSGGGITTTTLAPTAKSEAQPVTTTTIPTFEVEFITDAASIELVGPRDGATAKTIHDDPELKAQFLSDLAAAEADQRAREQAAKAKQEESSSVKKDTLPKSNTDATSSQKKPVQETSTTPKPISRPNPPPEPTAAPKSAQTTTPAPKAPPHA